MMVIGWSISLSIYFESLVIILEMLVEMWVEHLHVDLFRSISFLPSLVYFKVLFGLFMSCFIF